MPVVSNVPYIGNLKRFILGSSKSWKVDNSFQILQIIYIGFQNAS